MATLEATQIWCEADDLSSALSIVAPICGERTPKPILNCVHIVAKDGVAVVQATNLEHGLQIAVKCEGDGEICCSCEKLRQAVGLCGERIELVIEPKQVTVISNRSKWNIGMAICGEYPAINCELDSPKVTVPSKWLQSAISFVMHSINKNPKTTRVLEGAYFDFSDKKSLSVVGTDGNRMSFCTLPVKSHGGSCYIPKVACQRLLNSLPEEGDAVIRWNENLASIRTRSVAFVSGQLVGRFPNWSQHVPHRNDFVSLSRRDLIECIKRAAVATDQFSEGVSIKAKHGTASFTAKTEGESSECEMVVPESVSIDSSFRHRYLTEGLMAFDGETVEASFGEPDTQAIFRDGEFTEIVSPLA